MAEKLRTQEGCRYLDQVASIAAYIKLKGFKRPGEAVVDDYYKVESKGLITSKWTSEIIAGIAA